MPNDGDLSYTNVEYLLKLDRKRIGRQLQEKVLVINNYIELIQKKSERENINHNIEKLKISTDSLNNYCKLMQQGL